MALSVTWQMGQQQVTVALPAVDEQRLLAAARLYVRAFGLLSAEEVATATAGQVVRTVIRHQMEQMRRVARQEDVDRRRAQIESEAEADGIVLDG